MRYTPLASCTLNIVSELCGVITTPSEIPAPQDVKLTASNDDYYFVFEDFLYQVGVSRVSQPFGLKQDIFVL